MEEPLDDDEREPGLEPGEVENVRADLDDLAGMRQVFQVQGVKGVVIACPDCGENHFYEWDLLSENLEHMHFEETHNMAVLWSACSDDEIMAIEHAIVASIPPDMMMKFVRWMLLGMPHPDRVGMLAAMRDSAPAEAFEAVRTLARAHLEARDWRKLEAALDLAAQAA